jgi:hypothetical protein
MKRIAHLLGLGLAWVLVSLAAQAETVYEYGAKCASEVTIVPPFNCMQGELIPITVNGKTPSSYTPNMTCDKPSLLPVTAQGAQGQCLPGSRALVLRDDNTAQISAICRKYVVRDINSYLFDEINIVAYNLKNGKTCWFTATAAQPVTTTTGLDGRYVPSPTASPNPPAAQAPAAPTVAEANIKKGQARWQPVKSVPPPPDKFWLQPAQVAALNCVSCHDSGPYMYSPYIAQTTQVPSNPFGRYWPKAVGSDFQWWQQPFGITTRGNTCTTCHRMGNMNSCNVAALQSTGRAPQNGADAWSTQFPQSHWMSPGNLHSQAQWDETFRRSLAKITACCQNPQGPECQTVDYNAPGVTSSKVGNKR